VGSCFPLEGTYLNKKERKEDKKERKEDEKERKEDEKERKEDERKLKERKRKAERLRNTTEKLINLFRLPVIPCSVPYPTSSILTIDDVGYGTSIV